MNISFVNSNDFNINTDKINCTKPSFEGKYKIKPQKDIFLRRAHRQNPESIRKNLIMNEPEKYMKKFINKDYIQSAFDAHKEEITDVLGQFGYEPKIEMSHAEDVEGHLLGTYNFAKNITESGEFDFSEEERFNLLEAALIHDIGKVLIPCEILNKPGKLDPNERAVMDLHSELGYILLKDSGLSEQTLNAVRNHHHKEQTGDDVTELLSISDEVSALKERRPYKPKMPDYEVATILSIDAGDGKISRDLTRTVHNTLYGD